MQTILSLLVQLTMSTMITEELVHCTKKMATDFMADELQTKWIKLNCLLFIRSKIRD